MVQSDKGIWVHSAFWRRSRDVFVHISAVERAGLSSLNEGKTVEYEIETNLGKVAELSASEYQPVVRAAYLARVAH